MLHLFIKVGAGSSGIKKYIIALSLVLLAGCSSIQNTVNISKNELIIGVWEMTPIDGFVTYVNEFKPNREIYSYWFMCQDDGSYTTRGLDILSYEFIEANRLTNLSSG